MSGGEELDSRTILDTEVRRGAGVYAPRGIALVRGAGARVWDAEGREYLDAIAQYGVAPLGHAHPALCDAIATQARTLIDCQGTFGNDVRARYVEELVPHLPPGLDRVFLCNSGTEAVEAALKFARATTGRPGVIAAHDGFHGRTFGAVSATANPKYRKPFEPLVPGFRHVPYDDVEALSAAVGDDVGAVVLEPVQGEGGVRPASPGYLAAAAAICRERGALLVLDEVQTGFGRTGRMFACEHDGVVPDLLCLAKGIAGGFPMGACALGPRVPSLPVGVHGTTFGGNPLACAAARATLKVLLDEDLAAKAAKDGEFLMARLRAIDSPLVREVRGRGLMVGVDLRIPSQGVLKAMQEEGVLALPAGPTVVRLLPPLIVTRDELEHVALVLGRVLARPEFAARAAPRGAVS